jgi:hypothetical protein
MLRFFKFFIFLSNVLLILCLYHEKIGNYDVILYGKHYFLIQNGSRASFPDRYTKLVLAPAPMYPLLTRDVFKALGEHRIPSLFDNQPNDRFLSLPHSKAILSIEKVFPNILNPSFLYWNNKIVISFRCSYTHSKILILSKVSSTSTVEEDIEMLKKLDVSSLTSVSLEFYGEDPRIVTTGVYTQSTNSYQRLFVILCFRSHKFLPELTMEYAEVALNQSNNDIPYFLNSTSHYINIEGELSNEDQKNWMPFEPIEPIKDPSSHPLLYVTCIHPHRIAEVSYTPSDSSSSLFPNTTERANAVFGRTLAITKGHHRTWPYGHLRGGSQALLIDNQFYLTFFHSSTEPIHPVVNKTYVMGAYTFCPYYPYKILSMSDFPIIHQSMYEGKWHNLAKSYMLIDYIVFPMSFFLGVNRTLYLTFGKQDQDGWITKMNLDELLKSLVSTNHGCSKIDSKHNNHSVPIHSHH